MPYIKPNDRQRYDELIEHLVQWSKGEGVGPLNYIITRLIHMSLPPTPCYRDLNEMIGVLECAKASLIETVVIPYEKKKMKENGHISDLDQEYHDEL